MKKKVVNVLIVCFFWLNTYSQSQNKSFELPEGATLKKDLVYSVINGKQLLLDLYLPAESENPPLVIWVHGGAWQGGSKNNPRHALKLLTDGFAIASINYRLSKEAIFPAQIIDCKASVRWLRANAKNFGYNVEKIGAWGSSAGGHLVALMGTSGKQKQWDVGDNLNFSSAVQAVCDWYGPTDFLKMDDAPGGMVHLSENSPESMLIGGDIRNHPEKVQEVNSITYISESTPPFLIMHGKKDKTVIHQQSVLLYDALKAKEIDSELILLDNAGHGGAYWGEQVPVVSQFFSKHLNTPLNKNE